MKRRGSALLETALWVPILVLLMMGTLELARITYTYYHLQKMMVSLARYLGTQQNVNFCDPADLTVQSAKQYVVTGTPDGSGEPIVPNLTADRIEVRIERYVGETDSLTSCDCAVSATGCDTGQGAHAPDYLVVTIPEGYPMPVRIPGLVLDPIPLRPVVRLPYGGT